MKNFKLTSQLTSLYIALFSASVLTACGGSSDALTADLTAVEPTSQQMASTQSFPVYDVGSGEIPFPHNALFSGSTDGTLNIPVEDTSDIADPKNAMNQLDGFSTSAPITFKFKTSVDATTVNTLLGANNIKLFALNEDGQATELTAGVDFLVALQADQTSVAILPLKPLQPKTEYVVAVTNQVKDLAGNATSASFVYDLLKRPASFIDGQKNSLVAALSKEKANALEPLRLMTQKGLAAIVSDHLKAADLTLSWSFTTQSVGDVLAKVTTEVTNSSLAVQASGVNTSAVGAAGVADIYVGRLSVPYYLALPTETEPTAPLTSRWTGQTGSDLTHYSVALGDFPKMVSEQTISVLMTVPNVASRQTQPESGWPVVIFQHGITQNRSNVLAIADSLAAAGYVAVAIDLPLHGITPSDSAANFRIDGVAERNFDLDLVTQDSTGSITALAPDAIVDTSGRHFIQLTSLLTTRDNLRQGMSDLVQLKAALNDVAGVNLNANDVSFIGHSLGGMVGAGFVKKATDLKAAVFAMSGTQASYILTNSPTFSPEINAGLAAKGIDTGTADYQSFLLAAQTVMDAADPVNYVSDITVPTLVLNVVGDGNEGTDDQVIPNAVASAPLAGTNSWINLQSLSLTAELSADKVVRSYTEGSHGSLFDPSVSPATTQQMQTDVVQFLMQH